VPRTFELTERAGLRQNLDESQHRALTLLAHYGYGAAAGAVYTALAQQLPGPPPLRGITFGLGVWTVSYLGLLPALGVLRVATEHPARRNALMIAAHVVWGAALGLLADRFEQSRRDRAAQATAMTPTAHHAPDTQLGAR
jgi:uncharacterized membrane protein YagU involved in acid resistance